MGDRRGFIGRALARLGSLGALRVSREYVNSADGYVSSNEFINVAAVLTVESEKPLTHDDACAFLRRVKAIEREISDVEHRNADGTYREREIDIDIIAVAGFRMTTPELTLPHPRAACRDFVKIPLAELIGKEAVATLLTEPRLPCFDE